ncbi:hypothetical protein GCE86_04670 [Micromonospora terminaliae]|uniref:Uncharacterized protein n=1 Tax=Micromonospora terminaliae TaxID=1914461 RepID=A0AAJ2ZII0_9ACTN|nr:hypothetical protein [Micromonospora terminaliae]NES30360.1 hypothetical protein [Micromonospora terminaliae]QGL46409.1 hypothetical protein GCE86_04670 [Micromonospora terminaliae]
MTPPLSRLLRWAAVIGLGVALTLAAWQDPVLADGPDRSADDLPTTAVAVAAAVGFGLALAGRRRPLRVSRRPVPSRPLSASRPRGTRRSRR